MTNFSVGFLSVCRNALSRTPSPVMPDSDRGLPLPVVIPQIPLSPQGLADVPSTADLGKMTVEARRGLRQEAKKTLANPNAIAPLHSEAILTLAAFGRLKHPNRDDSGQRYARTKALLAAEKHPDQRFASQEMPQKLSKLSERTVNGVTVTTPASDIAAWWKAETAGRRVQQVRDHAVRQLDLSALDSAMPVDRRPDAAGVAAAIADIADRSAGVLTPADVVHIWSARQMNHLADQSRAIYPMEGCG